VDVVGADSTNPVDVVGNAAEADIEGNKFLARHMT
jgi:hypothetical protein